MIKKDIAECVSKVIKLPETEIMSFVSRSMNPVFGDFQIPCFSLSKLLRKSPAAIANELSSKIELPDTVEAVKAVNGYLNFSVKRAPFYEEIIAEIFEKSGKYGTGNTGQGKTCLIEHTSINPNASPHVGRARNALIGDFLSRLLKFEGYQVSVHYFVNDIGKQISMLAIAAENQENVRFEQLLDLYIQVNERLEKEPELEDRVFELLYKLENGDAGIIEKFRRIVDICIEGQTKIFCDLDICYDSFDYESGFIFDGSVDSILEDLFRTDRVFEDEDNRYVLDLKDYELPPLVITRNNKTSLYPLRDIAYSIWKAKHNCDKNIIVLGEDQKLYHKQVSAALDILGYMGPEAVHYSFVLLREGKMSTRKGTVVLLKELMQEAENKALKGILDRNGVNDDNRAKAIGYGAAKYAILKNSNEKSVVFDWDSALNFEGDSAPYMQYAIVRIKSVLNKVEYNENSIDFSLLKGDYEFEVIKLLYDFPDAVSACVSALSPHILTKYAFSLTKAFSALYQNCRLINHEDEIYKNTMLKLFLAVKQVLVNCLDLLGITEIDVM